VVLVRMAHQQCQVNSALALTERQSLFRLRFAACLAELKTFSQQHGVVIHQLC